MTIRTELETLFFIFFGSIACILGIFFLNQKKPQQPVHLVVPFADTIFLTPTPSPTLTQEPSVTIVSQLSSDGKEKVSVKTQKASGTNTYTIAVTDIEKKLSTTILSQTTATESAITITFNTFSPNNTYFFLKQMQPDGVHYLVFQTSGDSFGNGEKYLDVTQRFAAYSTSYALSEATGWGDNTLLIVNAKTSEGKGISFWFVVPSGGWIPLANYFP